MATTKTLAPTNQTITIDAFQGEKPDHRHVADAETKLADAVNALNSQIGTMFTVFKTVAYSQAVTAGSTITVPVETGAGTYLVFVSRSDKRKTGMFITDAYGTTELISCGVAVSLTTNGVVIQNNNAFTMSATVYRVV